MSAVALDLRSLREQLGVARRISDIPVSAKVRGVWFSMASDYIRRRGQGDYTAVRSAIPRRTRVPFLTYSLREYVEELALTAAIAEPSDPQECMRKIWRQATAMYIATPLGRSVMRLIGVDLVRYLQWAVDHRDHFCNYGSWSLVRRGPTYVTVEMENEYIWIESAHRGGAESVLAAFGLTGTVEPECFDDYNGRLHIRWKA